MKNTFILVALVFVFTTCSEEKLKLYDGAQDIYFDIKTGTNNASRLDSMFYSFAASNSFDTIINIPVIATGNIVNFDRYFKFEIDTTNAIEGLDYEKLDDQFIYPAGDVTSSIPVKIFRREEETENKFIKFRLLPSDDFTTDLSTINVTTNKTLNVLEAKLVWTSRLARPSKWIVSVLGYFSQTKFLLVNEITGSQPGDWTTMVTGMVYASGIYAENYIYGKILEGPEEALKDPYNPNAEDKGYMSMRGRNNTKALIPDDFPNLLEE